MVVFIDNGHGVNTSGKRSVDSELREYLWTRQVAALVVDSLRKEGVDARLVAPEEHDIPLSVRADRVNSVCKVLGNKKVILVSIHINAAGDGSKWMSAKGWSAYTSPGVTLSDTLAECLYDFAEEEFTDRKIRKDYGDHDRDFEANLFILKKTLCPAVLTENFFMDNKEEKEFLLSDETKQRVADIHFKGILKFLRSHAK